MKGLRSVRQPAVAYGPVVSTDFQASASTSLGFVGRHKIRVCALCAFRVRWANATGLRPTNRPRRAVLQVNCMSGSRAGQLNGPSPMALASNPDWS